MTDGPTLEWLDEFEGETTTVSRYNDENGEYRTFEVTVEEVPDIPESERGGRYE